MVDCLNLRLEEAGIVPYVRPTNPFSGLTISFPFPQLFMTETETILAEATAINLVTKGSPNWTSAAITPYSSNAFGSELVSTWTAGSGWTLPSSLPTFSGVSAGNLTQTITGAGQHRITYTIAGVINDDGYVEVSLGGTAPNKRYAPGTYTEIISATGSTTLQIRAANATITIPSISCKAITSTTVTTGGIWHFASTGIGYVLTNGVNSFVKFPSWPLLKMSDFLVRSCCAYRNRIFLGYPDTPSSFNTQFDTYRNSYSASLSGVSNVVVWTDPAGLALQYLVAPWSVTESKIMESLDRGDWGMVEVPFMDTIIKLLPLEDGVVIYGQNRIYLMYPVEGGFGLRELAPFGILQRGNAGGNTAMHLFIDSKGYLNSLTAKGYEQLGYKEYFTSTTNAVYNITYDYIKQEFYLGNAEKSFIYNRYGLVELTDSVNCIFNWDGAILGLYTAGSNAAYAEFDLGDMGSRKHKTVKRVQVTGVDPGFQAAPGFRKDSSTAYEFTSLVDLEDNGDVSVQGGGTELALKLSSTSFTNATIEDIVVDVDTQKGSIGGLLS